jgi:hypothetical protein
MEKLHHSTYKRNQRILDVQKCLLDEPETVQHMSKRIGIYFTTLRCFLVILHKAKGCKRVKRHNLQGGPTYLYYIGPDSEPFNVGESVISEGHANPADGWTRREPPTDDPKLNTLMGYTDFIPPRGEHMKERHASWTGRKTEFGIQCVELM